MHRVLHSKNSIQSSTSWWLTEVSSFILNRYRDLCSLRSTSPKSNTRSCKTKVPSTIEYATSLVFNSLPKQCRSTNYILNFFSEAKKFLKHNALVRILEISKWKLKFSRFILLVIVFVLDIVVMSIKCWCDVMIRLLKGDRSLHLVLQESYYFSVLYSTLLHFLQYHSKCNYVYNI